MTGEPPRLADVIEPHARLAPPPDSYAFTATLTREQWAWEFLRRNPGYRRDWAMFQATWRDLEAAYGSPPNRDFPAWRRDPRAWVHVSDCPDGECRVDQDKVLIECALGARYGFHKFPPDPGDPDPVGAGRLTWRETSRELVRELAPGDLEGLGAAMGSDPALAVLAFDLSHPLRDQLDQAKRRLQKCQRQRVRSGTLTLVSVAGLRGGWAQALRLLDAQTAGADGLVELCGEELEGDLLAEAERLRDGGYLEILNLPER